MPTNNRPRTTTETKEPRERVDVYQLVTDQITALLNKGVVPWRRPWTCLGHGIPRNLATGRAYRGINVLMLASAPYASPWWLTFKQAKALGAEIPKGTRTTPVIFWKPLVLPAKPGEKGAHQNPDGTWVKTPLLLKHYRVFNTDQLEGLKDRIPAPETPAEVKPTDERARALLDAFHTREHVGLGHGGDRAFYAPATDHIQIPNFGQFETEAAYWGTRFHEAVHATGHPDRLARPAITALGPESTFGSETYAQEELVAEMGAAMLAAHTGLEEAARDPEAMLRPEVVARPDPMGELAKALHGSSHRHIRMLKVSRYLAVLLYSMHWTLVTFEKGHLATSDQPVVLWPANRPRRRPAAHDLNAGLLGLLEVFVPVAPDLLLLMTWETPGSEDRVQTGHGRPLATANSFVIANAEVQWFHSLGQAVWQSRGSRQPLSSDLVPGYDAQRAMASRRRLEAERLMTSEARRPLSNDPLEAIG